MWKWAAASRRGSSHERANTRLQDAFSCFVSGPANDYLVALVSDGAGSAAFGGQGANLICRTIATLARHHLKVERRLPTDVEVYAWADDIRDLLASVAERRAVPLREFAGTLVCLISDGEESVICHVGDGCAVVREHGADDWTAASWPEHGEYASTTFFMTDDAELRLRITRCGGKIGAVALFSDGLERLALDFSTKTPFAGFFNAVIATVVASVCHGRDPTLSATLKGYLGSATILARLDDDKTLVLAVRQ